MEILCAFEDLGEALLVDGEARIALAPAYTASITGKYQVQLTAYGAALLWVAAREHDHFIVRSAAAPGTRSSRKVRFGWRGVARRGDIKTKRFAKVELDDADRVAPVPARAGRALRYALSERVEVAPKRTNPLGHAMATRPRRPLARNARSSAAASAERASG